LKEAELFLSKRSGQWACVQVVDGGEGISEVNLDKVFDPWIISNEQNDSRPYC
jgi:K+-sensing histidine kinase KdpD